MFTPCTYSCGRPCVLEESRWARAGGRRGALGAAGSPQWCVRWVDHGGQHKEQWMMSVAKGSRNAWWHCCGAAAGVLRLCARRKSDNRPAALHFSQSALHGALATSMRANRNCIAFGSLPQVLNVPEKRMNCGSKATMPPKVGKRKRGTPDSPESCLARICARRVH
jgi:hypothetical protein